VAEQGGERWGQASPLEADAPNWAGGLFGFEVRIAVGAAPSVRYQPLPTQPPARRDLSLVVPAGLTAAEIEAVLRREGGQLVELIEVIDEYRGPGLPEGTRSLTWRCTFRDPQRTLTEGDVNKVVDRIVKGLTAIGVHRRES
jgi:phenylalanyl-tRNA synthetase beta chain